MAPKSVTFRRHDHLVSVLFGDLLSHSYNITCSMFLYLVYVFILYSYLCILGSFTCWLKHLDFFIVRFVLQRMPSWLGLYLESF